MPSRSENSSLSPISSNVESYLFEGAGRGAVPNASWDMFIANLRALPADASSLIVRTPSRNVTARQGGNNGGLLDSLATSPIQKVIEAVDKGAVREYADLFR